jgi:hypothetical protein
MSNLLPAAEKKRIVESYRTRFSALIFLSAMILALTASVFLLPSLFFLKNAESVFAGERDSEHGRGIRKVQDTLAATTADLNIRLAALPQAEIASPMVGAFIDPVLKMKTPAIHITDFEYSGADTAGNVIVLVSGTALSRATLLSFADKLRVKDHFVHVSVPIETSTSGSSVAFTISAVLPHTQ